MKNQRLKSKLNLNKLTISNLNVVKGGAAPAYPTDKTSVGCSDSCSGPKECL